MMDQVNIMGCNYKIIRVSRDQYKTCEGADGWCDFYGKKIYYVDPEADPDSDPIATSPKELVKQVLRHEIVHAFLAESGLTFNSHSIVGAWAMNEEMVDWIAWNGDKLHKAWKETGLVE